ncbi:hypothetical protein CDL12_02714 [Handroanthus impetiginosus]|uniref:Uncharacterized protein n=1 Tax=Handroanthus impetiginosus TaxID=429701 RepID=A0A2G9I473_9LAMI|nr:hypothetical protein CDL12_02714 [Handroanthus impetiginosus]
MTLLRRFHVVFISEYSFPKVGTKMTDDPSTCLRPQPPWHNVGVLHYRFIQIKNHYRYHVLGSGRVIVIGCHPEYERLIHFFTVIIMFKICNTFSKGSVAKHELLRIQAGFIPENGCNDVNNLFHQLVTF